MNIIQYFIPVSRNNRPAYPLYPEYITIHDTENFAAGANALMHAEYLKGDAAANRPASWHYTVDDKRIVQHLPLDENGWHAGDGDHGPGNRKSVAIEICVNADGDYEKAKDNASQLTAYLMKTLNLPVEAIVQHNKWSGKDCPRQIRKVSGGWDRFLQSVVNYYSGGDEEEMLEELQRRIADLEAKASQPVPDWAREAVDAAVKCGIVKEPDGGSLDFYRILTVLHRKGLI